MLSVVRWDDKDTFINNLLCILDDCVSGGVHLCLCNNLRIDRLVFIKYFVDIMPFEAKPKPNFLTSYNSLHQCDGCVKVYA